MKKFQLFTLILALLLPLAMRSQTHSSEQQIQKRKTQQALAYYLDLANQGETKAKEKADHLSEYLSSLDSNIKRVFVRKAANANTYVDPNSNVTYSYNPENGTASVIESTPTTPEVDILESFTVEGKKYIVNNIDKDAFDWKRNIVKFRLPKSITSIHREAFNHNINVNVIEVAEGNPVYDSRNNCNAIIDTTNTLVWGCKGTIIPDGVVEIGEDAFQGFDSPENPNFPASLVRIGDSFLQCDNLKELHIPATVGYIYNRNPFWGCDSLSIIEVAEGNPVYDSRNNCNSIIQTETNSLVAGCMSSVIPDGIQTIGTDAFYCCDRLPAIHIPASVSRISGTLTFANCRSVLEITVDEANEVYDSRSECNAIIETLTNKLIAGCRNSIIPEGIGIIGGYAFYGQDELISIVLPESITEIGENAFSDTGLKYVNIPESVNDIGRNAFSSCYYLDSIASFIRYPFAIDSYVFKWGADDGTLYVPYGTAGLYQATDGWKEIKNIVEMSEGTSFSLNIIDETGNDVTSRCSVIWYDMDGRQIGQGATLGGIADGSEVYLSVILDEDLGRKYRDIVKQKIVIEKKTFTCKLETINKVQLTGKVSALDIDTKEANIHITQRLNGKYEEHFATTTDEKGYFAIEVFNDETEITISRDDCINAILSRNRLDGKEDIGTIHLSLISGFPIIIEAVYVQSAVSGETADAVTWNNGIGNMEFALKNETTGLDITDFVTQNNTLIIKTGASIGNRVKINVKSRLSEFADSETSFVVREDLNKVVLQLIELGGIKAVYSNSANGSNVANLYDSKGMSVSRSNYIGQELSILHLASGNYNLISMQKSDLFGSVSKITDLRDMGLQEGKDYVSTSVEIKDGEIATVLVENIPSIDETPFYYTNKNAYFNSNKDEVTVGHYITLSAHVELKDNYAGQLEDASLIVELPEDCEMVKGSAMIGRNMATYTQDGDKIMIPLTKENYLEKIRFCIIPLSNRDYNVTAYVSLNLGNQVLQPIGIAQFTGKGLSINLPSSYASPQVNINGTALGQSEVKIYDNDILIGTTQSKQDGSWSAIAELHKPYSPSYHNIFAKIKNSDGIELTSETRQLLYDKENIVPNKAVMSFYNGWYKKNIEVVFDLNNGTTTPSSYPFFTATDFTFTADFTLNDTTRVKNVNFKVLASDGTIRTIPGIFDEKLQAWVGTSRYSSSSKLPENVTMEYDVIPVEVPFDSTRIIDDNNQFINLVKNYVQNVDTTKFEIVDAKEMWMICKYQTHTMDEPVYFRFEQLDYDKWIGKMESMDFFTVQYNGKTTCMKDSLFADRSFNWIWTNDNKIMLQIETCQSNDFPDSNLLKTLARRAYPQTAIGQGLSWFSTIFGISNIVNEYNQGYADLQYWLGKYSQTTNDHFKLYNKTKQLLEARCPDGSLRLSNTAYDWYQTYLGFYFSDANTMRQSFQMRLNWMERDLVSRRNSATVINASLQALFLLLPETGLGAAAANRFGTAVTNRFGGTIRNWLLNNLGEAIDAAIETRYSNMISSALNWLNNSWYTADQLSSWYYLENKKIIQNYSELQALIQKSYKKCEKQKEEKDDDEKKEQKKYNEEYNDKSNQYKPNYTNPPSKVILDPSGYVYEAVMSNRLEGVVATVYHKEQKEDMYGDTQEEVVKWNAEAYSQKNPLITDAAGFYSWDVPQGMWQVKYEKEGYETIYSEWLPVPPPQLDVNIAMTQSTPPTVKLIRGFESGITIEMSKYMRPATLDINNVLVTRNGMAVKGSIDITNLEKEPNGDAEYASKLKFVPESPFDEADVVIVTVRKEVESYCRVNMPNDYVQQVKIEPEIKEIVADSTISISYQGAKEIQIVVLPKAAALSKTLRIQTSSPMIASLSAEEILLDEKGSATITLNGELPGSAFLTFTIDDTDVMALSQVKVVTANDIVATPQASIKSGETVAAGTQLVLTCDTDGATIYYTLDGSCPCDETMRIKYESPIVINSDVIVKAIAVKDDLDDSDIVTFVYLLNSTDIASIDKSGVRIWPYVTSSTIHIDLNDLKAENITIVNMNGMTMYSAVNVKGQISIDLGSYVDGIYIVNVKCKDGRIVRKIVKLGK